MTPGARAAEGKPVGSVHGASVGLHAADTANAWRGIAAAIGETLRDRDQKTSCALAERHGEFGRDPDALIAVLIKPAITHDGALHHEKYFHTATQGFARSRPGWRWDHLVALTRVMASGYGFADEDLAAARIALAV